MSLNANSENFVIRIRADVVIVQRSVQQRS